MSGKNKAVTPAASLSSSSIATQGTKSMLPKYILDHIQKGIKDKLQDNSLMLCGRWDIFLLLLLWCIANVFLLKVISSSSIHDGIIPELFEWIVKLGDKVKVLKWVSIFNDVCLFFLIFSCCYWTLNVIMDVVADEREQKNMKYIVYTAMWYHHMEHLSCFFHWRNVI